MSSRQQVSELIDTIKDFLPYVSDDVALNKIKGLLDQCCTQSPEYKMLQYIKGNKIGEALDILRNPNIRVRHETHVFLQACVHAIRKNYCNFITSTLYTYVLSVQSLMTLLEEAAKNNSILIFSYVYAQFVPHTLRQDCDAEIRNFSANVLEKEYPHITRVLDGNVVSATGSMPKKFGDNFKKTHSAEIGLVHKFLHKTYTINDTIPASQRLSTSAIQAAFKDWCIRHTIAHHTLTTSVPFFGKILQCISPYNAHFKGSRKMYCFLRIPPRAQSSGSAHGSEVTSVADSTSETSPLALSSDCESGGDEHEEEEDEDSFVCDNDEIEYEDSASSGEIEEDLDNINRFATQIVSKSQSIRPVKKRKNIFVESEAEDSD